MNNYRSPKVLCIERLRWDDNHEDLLADLLFEGHSMSTVCFAIDSGCDRSCVTLSTVEMFGLEQNLDRSRRTKFRALGLLDETVGTLKTKLKCQDENSPVLIEEIEVVRSGHDLLGLDILKKFSCTVKVHPKSPCLIVRKQEDQCFKNSRTDNRLIKKEVLVAGNQAKGLLDTGACCSFIPESLVRTLGLEANELTKPIKVITANKTIVPFNRKVEKVDLVVEGFRTRVDLIVHPNLKEMLIGTDGLQDSRLDFFCDTMYVTSIKECKTIPDVLKKLCSINVIIPSI